MTDTAATAADISDYPTPRDRKCPFLPSPELRAMHAAGAPMSRVRTWDDRTPWLIASHATQRQVMGDPRASSNEELPGFPYMTRSIAETAHEHPKTLFNTDGPEHAQLRRMLTNSFTRGRMEKIRPAIQKVADDLIDKMLAGPNPTDLVQALSLPLPSLMICELLGVPYEDHDFFEVHSKVATSAEKAPEDTTASNKILGAYVGKLIETKMAHPAEDVLSDLGARVKSGDLDMRGATMMGMILLIAGHETSANMITMATALLLRNPDQLAIVRETDNRKVIAGAVEELLRYLTIPHLLQRRIALEDIEVEAGTIRAGEGIIASLPAANFDPAVFPDPEKLDLTRDARQHHAFGWGPHQCIGQQLARIELEVVYGTLFRRIPTLRLATDFDELRFKDDSLAYGIYELPIAW